MKTEYPYQYGLKMASEILRKGEKTISRIAGLFMALFALGGWKMLLATQHIDSWTGFVRSIPCVATLAVLILVLPWVIKRMAFKTRKFVLVIIDVYDIIKDFMMSIIAIYIIWGFFTYTSENNHQLIYAVVCATIAIILLALVRGILFLICNASEIKRFLAEARDTVRSFIHEVHCALKVARKRSV